MNIAGLLDMFPRGSRRSRAPREHVDNPDRSPEWNAWRAKQALAPRGRAMAATGHRHKPELPTEWERRQARLSTRASRRRRDRARSLARRS